MNADYWIFYGFSITLCFFVGTYLGWRWAVLSDEPEEKKPVNTKAQATLIWLAGDQERVVTNKDIPFAGGRVSREEKIITTDGKVYDVPKVSLHGRYEQSLEDMLQQAIDEENYLLAAKVRDLINKRK